MLSCTTRKGDYFPQITSRSKIRQACLSHKFSVDQSNGVLSFFSCIFEEKSILHPQVDPIISREEEGYIIFDDPIIRRSHAPTICSAVRSGAVQVDSVEHFKYSDPGFHIHSDDALVRYEEE